MAPGLLGGVGGVLLLRRVEHVEDEGHGDKADQPRDQARQRPGALRCEARLSVSTLTLLVWQNTCLSMLEYITVIQEMLSVKLLEHPRP